MKFIKLSAILFFLSASMHAQPVSQGTGETTERPISVISAGDMMKTTFSFSSNMRRIAYVKPEGEKVNVVIDGIPGKPCDYASTPVFSPDGNRFAYAFRKGDAWYLNLDNKMEIAISAGAEITTLLYTPDSRGLVYITAQDGSHKVVFNGQEGKSYESIDGNSLTFSSDGSHIAYSASNNGRSFIVHDGEESAGYDRTGFPVLSPDGKRLAFWGITNNKVYVNADKKENGPYDEAGSIIFSNDGTRLAWKIAHSGQQMIVLDGQEGPGYTLVHSPCFSKDGKNFAYAIDKGDKKELTHYVVMNDNLSSPYETIVEGSLQFTADGKDVIFKAEIHDEFFMVIRSKDGKHYHDVLQSTFSLSNDNQRYAYVAENENGRFAVLNGEESPAYNDVFDIAISPDGKRFAYSAKKANDEFVVVDGNARAAYDSIMGQGQVVFDSPDTFHYFAIRNNQIFLVEESCKKSESQ